MTKLQAVALLAAAAVFGGAGFAAGAGSADTVTVCAVKAGAKKGSMRLVSSKTKCRRGERRVRWNEQGVPGLPGRPGAQGPTGAQGPAGPSEAANQGLFAGGSGLALQAGGYVVSAHVKLRNGGAEAIDITCTMTVGTAQDITTVTVPAGARVVVPLQQIHQLAQPGAANASCDGGDWNGLIIARRVGLVREI